jgi:hypothetical protein
MCVTQELAEPTGVHGTVAGHDHQYVHGGPCTSALSIDNLSSTKVRLPHDVMPGPCKALQQQR